MATPVLFAHTLHGSAFLLPPSHPACPQLSLQLCSASSECLDYGEELKNAVKVGEKGKEEELNCFSSASHAPVDKRALRRSQVVSTARFKWIMFYGICHWETCSCLTALFSVGKVQVFINGEKIGKK